MCSALSAQVTISKGRFASLSKAHKDLYLRIKKSDSLKTGRVSNYLKGNLRAKGTYRGDDGRIFVLTDIILGKPIYTTTYNADSAIAVGADHLQVDGGLGLDLDGTGITVGVWDEGPVQETHSEFENANNGDTRVQNVEFIDTDGQAQQNNHATHVSGTIIAKGVDSRAKGMATAASVKTYNFRNDTTEMVTEALDGEPFILSNHSYGVPVDGTDPWFMGAYTSGAVDIDDIARDFPGYLIVQSAGNSGTVAYDGGLAPNRDKLTGDKTAKNNLVVANANAVTENGELFYSINNGSSQGPTDDLRIKPDIAGDGTAVYSTITGDTYDTYTGTSMASPNVTGSLVLLQQYYKRLNGVYMNSASLKGLVCHTARDVVKPRREGYYPVGPDPVFGWGMLNAKYAAETIAADDSGAAIMEERSLANGSTYVLNFNAAAGEQLRATICWTDLPGTAVADGTLNSTEHRALVNDLDIVITRNGTEYFPWRLGLDGIGSITNSKGNNDVDNVERIDIDTPETGEYTLTVSHKGTLVEDIQNFSLILTGSNVVLGVEDNNLSRSLRVFPNPSNGEFTISFDSKSSNDVKIDVYDLSGRAVYNNIFINTASQFRQSVNLGNMQSGIYVMRISEGDNMTSHKIVIE